MPRAARVLSEDGAPYHVSCRGNNRAAVFHDADDAMTFLRIIESSAIQHISLHHYCLMSNHYHLLLTPHDHRQLAFVMKRINLRYSLYYKRKYGTSGHLWQGRYHSRIITDARYLIACGIYIELNPVRARMTDDPTLHLWSSHRYYVIGEPDRTITPHPLFLELGNTEKERQSQYKAMTLLSLTEGTVPFEDN